LNLRQIYGRCYITVVSKHDAFWAHRLADLSGVGAGGIKVRSIKVITLAEVVNEFPAGLVGRDKTVPRGNWSA
jgi:hypothetical protein